MFLAEQRVCLRSDVLKTHIRLVPVCPASDRQFAYQLGVVFLYFGEHFCRSQNNDGQCWTPLNISTHAVGPPGRAIQSYSN